MKFFISILLTAVLSFAAGLYLPWWSIAPAAFLVAIVFAQRPGRSFLSGFLGVFLFWTGMAYWLSAANQHLFAHKISMLIIKADSLVLIIFVSGLIGGLVAGFAALTGSYLRVKKS